MPKSLCEEANLFLVDDNDYSLLEVKGRNTVRLFWPIGVY